MPEIVRILHLEDNHTDAELIDRELRKMAIPLEKKRTEKKEEFIRLLETWYPDIILADHSLPSFNSLEALEIMRKKNIPEPFILITAFISEDFAVSVMKAGAWDYILKDRLQRLPSAVLNALERYRSEGERREYLRQVIFNEARLKETQRMAGIGSWQLDLPEYELTLSEEGRRIFGLSCTPTEDLHQTLLDHIHPEDLVAARAAFHRSVEEMNVFDTVYRVIWKDGTLKYLHVKSKTLTRETGGSRSIGSVQDITERTLAEQAIRASETALAIKNRELEIKNKELEQYAYVSSHDLQEPLITMSSFASLLQREYQSSLDEQAQTYLGFIVQSAERMRALIKGLLEYSQIGNNTSPAAVDCNDILTSAQQDLAQLITDSKAVIKADRLPVLEGYSAELRLLFKNLVSNAILFRCKSSIPELSISAINNGEDWLFSFADNGIGIDPVYHERIFILFQRLHPRGRISGMGIGLSHCRKVVELHKGRIWIESEAGKGATIYFTIPKNRKK